MLIKICLGGVNCTDWKLELLLTFIVYLAVGSICLGGRLAFAFSACLAERRHFLLFSFFLLFSLLLHEMFGQQDRIKLGQISLQAHIIARRRMINSVDALTRLALIGSVLLKKFAILLLRRGMGDWMRRVCC